MKLRIFASLIFLCGLVLLTTSIITARKASGKPLPQLQSFVVHYLVYMAEEGGSLKLSSYEERAVSFTGEWKETRRSIDGKVTILAGTKEGLYIINEQSKQLYGKSSAQSSKSQAGSEDILINHPMLARTEEIAGLKTYILKIQETGDEFGYAPETGQTFLKHIILSGPEGTPILIQEAVKVEFRELSEEELKIPDLPIKFDLLEQRIKAFRDSNRLDEANSLQRLMDNYKAIDK